MYAEPSHDVTEWSAKAGIVVILAYLLKRAKDALERDGARSQRLEAALAQRDAFEAELRGKLAAVEGANARTEAALAVCEFKHKATETELGELRAELARLRSRLENGDK